jgi:DNA repair exonuclease SbcCD ATPase subunit
LIISEERKRKLQALQKLNQEKADLIHNIDVRVQTIDFIEAVASNERNSVKEKVEKLITSCLHEVYDDSYSVEFDYGMKNSKTSVDIYIVRKCDDGMIVKRTIDGIGGGVADTVSLPLKLIVLMNDNDCDKVLFVDEPGKHLDTTRVQNFAKFLKIISEKLNVQIIMSSHHECMNDYADNIHKVTLNSSISEVERLK